MERKVQKQKIDSASGKTGKTGSKNKAREESKSMEKYVTGGEETIVKAMEKIGKRSRRTYARRWKG